MFSCVTISWFRGSTYGMPHRRLVQKKHKKVIGNCLSKRWGSILIATSIVDIMGRQNLSVRLSAMKCSSVGIGGNEETITSIKRRQNDDVMLSHSEYIDFPWIAAASRSSWPFQLYSLLTKTDNRNNDGYNITVLAIYREFIFL